MGKLGGQELEEKSVPLPAPLPAGVGDEQGTAALPPGAQQGLGLPSLSARGSEGSTFSAPFPVGINPPEFQALSYPMKPPQHPTPRQTGACLPAFGNATHRANGCVG